MSYKKSIFSVVLSSVLFFASSRVSLAVQNNKVVGESCSKCVCIPKSVIIPTGVCVAGAILTGIIVFAVRHNDAEDAEHHGKKADEMLVNMCSRHKSVTEVQKVLRSFSGSVRNPGEFKYLLNTIPKYMPDLLECCTEEIDKLNKYISGECVWDDGECTKLSDIFSDFSGFSDEADKEIDSLSRSISSGTATTEETKENRSGIIAAMRFKSYVQRCLELMCFKLQYYVSNPASSEWAKIPNDLLEKARISGDIEAYMH